MSTLLHTDSNLGYPSVVSIDGVQLVSSVNTSNTLSVYRRTSSTFSPTTLSTSCYSNPSMCYFGDSVYIVHTIEDSSITSDNNLGVNLFITDTSGSLWDTGSIISPLAFGYDCYNPSITVDDSGNLVVVFEVYDSDNSVYDVYEMYKLVSDDEWSTPNKVHYGATYALNDVTEEIIGDSASTNMEIWEGSLPKGWGTHGSVTERDTTEYYEGSSSMKITSSTYDNGPVYLNIDDIAGKVDKDKTLLLKLYGKVVTPLMECNIHVICGNYEQIVAFSNDSWGEVTMTIVGEEQGLSEDIVLYLYNTGPNDISYIDNIKLYNVPKFSRNKVTPKVICDNDIERGNIHTLYTRQDTASNALLIRNSALDGSIDITDDVQSIRVSRDKEFKTGKFGAGDFSAVFKNSDGFYTIENYSSNIFRYLKSGVELLIDFGFKEYNGSGDIYDETNWNEELYPSITGVATSFKHNSVNELITISGRDRATKFMEYQNYTSPMFENKQSIEVIEELINEDSDGDGKGDIDEIRPSVPLELGVDETKSSLQQTLTKWDSPVYNGLGSSDGDMGSNANTEFVLNTIPLTLSGQDYYKFIGAWVDRSDENYYLYTMSVNANPSDSTANMPIVEKWDSWRSGTPVLLESNYLSSSAGYLASGGAFNNPANNNGTNISVSPYDSDYDCVWVLSSAYYDGAYTSSIYHYKFRTNIITEIITWNDTISLGYFDITDKCSGCIIRDTDNDKLLVGHILSGTQDSEWRVFSMNGTSSLPGLVLDFDDYTTFQNVPMQGIKYGNYYYLVTDYIKGGEDINNAKLIAYSDSMVNAGLIDNAGSKNTALCGCSYRTDYDDWGNGEEFFTNTVTQNKHIRSIDFDDSTIYMFTCDTNSTSGVYGVISTSRYSISTGAQVRRLGSRLVNLSNSNIVTSDHTNSEGYLDNGIDYKWFSSEEIKFKNSNIDNETLPTVGVATYDELGVFELGNGESNISEGIEVEPSSTSPYSVNLETGELYLNYLPDKSNTITASYDYKESANYAWFEDMSVWDAIQEVASSGDYVCYVNEDGELKFKDRFTYYQPVLSDYTSYLVSSTDGWSGSSTYDLEATNIIPGLEYVMSNKPDKVTGKFKKYRRRSYKTNGVVYPSTTGDYDIDYDAGKISISDVSEIDTDERLLIYYYNKDYLYVYDYQSNIFNLDYKWGTDGLYNKIIVSGEKHFPSTSPLSVRQIYAVNPGDKVVNTKFSTLKQLNIVEPDDPSEGVTQKQFDEYNQEWRAAAGTTTIDLELDTKIIGDTIEARNSGKALRIKVTPCIAPSGWDSGTNSYSNIPDSQIVGQGWKVNWDYMGDTGAVTTPEGSNKQVNITNVEINCNGLVIEVDHLENTDEQYLIQVEADIYTLTRTVKVAALHEDFASIQKYYARTHEVSSNFITDFDSAKFRARMLCHFLSEERPIVEIEATGSPFIQLEDIVAVRDTTSGLSGDYFEVVGITHNFSKDDMTTKLKLRKICDVSSDVLGKINPVQGYAGGYIGDVALSDETWYED